MAGADNQDQGYVPWDPNKPLPKPATAPARDPNDQGYVPLYPAGGAQQPPPASAAPPGPGWGIDWSKRGGEVTMPQSVQDWGNIAGNEAGMNLVGLKAQADAARQRLGPTASASADLVGSALSPTTLLNAVPFVGPELAGAAHEGIKSKAAGNDWTTAGEDALGGGLAGLIGHGLTFSPDLSKEALKIGGGALFAKLAHPYLSGDYREMLGALGVYSGADKVAGKVANSPAAQQAVRSLVLGGASALRASSPGPLYNQWIPGQ